MHDLVSCPRNAVDYLNERSLSASIEWEFESRVGGTKPKANPNSKMVKIGNIFKAFGNLNLGLVSDLGFRASNFARGTSLVNLQRNLSSKGLMPSWALPLANCKVSFDPVDCRRNELQAAYGSDENFFSKSLPLMLPSLYCRLRQLSIPSLEMLIRP
jgi:hypothetical protein